MCLFNFIKNSFKSVNHSTKKVESTNNQKRKWHCGYCGITLMDDDWMCPACGGTPIDQNGKSK